jgi:hypothetical protein
MTAPTALLAQEAKRGGRLSQLVYLKQADEDGLGEEEEATRNRRRPL